MRLTSAQVVARIFTVSTEIGWEEGHFCGIYGGSFLDDVGVGLKIFRAFSKWPPPLTGNNKLTAPKYNFQGKFFR